MDLSRKEINLRVFQGKPIPHVFFQPRFEPWFDMHKKANTLPSILRGMDLRQAYDFIGASMRTVHYYTDQPDPIVITYSADVKITHRQEGDKLFVRFDTPFGPLFETQKYTQDATWRVIEFGAKTISDLKALRWLLSKRQLSFNVEYFKQGVEYLGDRGVPSFWVPKSPYFALAQQWMKYADFIYALNDYPSEIEDIMSVIDDMYDPLYEQLISPGVLQIINFGENVASAYISKKYFEKYVLPWYHKRSGQLRNADIFTHIHIDGYFRPLLPYLAHLPFDGLEALTPYPQGDVSLEEMKDAIGDKVLLDGIPAVLFLKHHSMEELVECTEKTIQYFHPRLVLGISDELPEGGDEESFERMRWISERCRRIS